jgi:hypothetical protein
MSFAGVKKDALDAVSCPPGWEGLEFTARISLETHFLL